MVQSFAIYVVQTLSPQSPPHIQKLLHQTAQHYISGREELTAKGIDDLSLALEKDGKLLPSKRSRRRSSGSCESDSAGNLNEADVMNKGGDDANGTKNIDGNGSGGGGDEDSHVRFTNAPMMSMRRRDLTRHDVNVTGETEDKVEISRKVDSLDNNDLTGERDSIENDVAPITNAPMLSARRRDLNRNRNNENDAHADDHHTHQPQDSTNEINPQNPNQINGLHTNNNPNKSSYIRKTSSQMASQLQKSLSRQDFVLELDHKEKFKQHLATCLTEIIYEYLSTNWHNMDALISVNDCKSCPFWKDEHNDNSLSDDVWKSCMKLKLQEVEQEKEGGETNKSEKSISGSNGNHVQPNNQSKPVDKNEKWHKLRKGLSRKIISQDLSITRKFVTMATILKSIEVSTPPPAVQQSLDTLFSSYYPPTIVFLGGGMGAGKSTVISHLKQKERGRIGAFFAGTDPLIIEADRMKMIDPIFQKLNKVEGGSNEVSQVVHAHSTEAANRQLLMALERQRTVVVDGTMTWLPYVKQTIEMVRKAHLFQFHLGPGYKETKHEQPDGRITTKVEEEYWTLASALSSHTQDGRLRLPYRVEMVGVTSDPEKAVARGLRRKLITNRGVPIRGQLRSHRLYSENFEKYLELGFCKVSLFDTSEASNGAIAGMEDSSGGQEWKEPQLVAMKEKGQPLLMEPKLYGKFLKKKMINDGASGVEDLYVDGTEVKFEKKYWTDILKGAFC